MSCEESEEYSKSEIRNSKQIRMIKIQMIKTGVVEALL